MHPRNPGSWLDPGAFGTLGKFFLLFDSIRSFIKKQAKQALALDLHLEPS